MFDLIDPWETSLRKENWKEDVQAALAGQERMIASFLGGQPVPERLQITLIKSNRTSLTVRLVVGELAFIVKIFADTGAVALESYQREKNTLVALRGHDVSARILGFCDERRFLIMNEVPAVGVNAAVDLLGWNTVAFAIGAWLGRLDRTAPSQPAHGTWANYLTKFGDEFGMDRMPAALDILSDIPLCGLTLAQCDSALGNVLMRSDTSAVGVDFERARFRPRGWDFAMYFMSLVERVPDRAEELLEEMCDGFSSEHRGALIVEELCTVARLILCLRASSFILEEDL